LPTPNPFQNKQIRSLQDTASNKWWFSAIDICAALTNYGYDAARKYWKWLKHSLATDGNQLVAITNQLKLKPLDGKLRFTDVLDITQVLYLIQIIPSKEAEPFRIWLAESAAANSTAADQLMAIGEKNVKATVDEVIRDDGKIVDLQTTTRRAFEV